MELKPTSPELSSGAPALLIVPYGIETSVRLPETSDHRLLIVPYGIETQ